MNGDIVIMVTDRSSKMVDHKVFERSKYQSSEKYEQAIARQIGIFERMYGESNYIINQGSASSLSSFFTVYPEFVQK